MNNSIDLNASEQHDPQDLIEPFSSAATRSKGKSEHVSKPGDVASHNSDQEFIFEAHVVNDQKKERKIKKTPLPKSVLFVLSLIVFSEPMNSTILFPFVYFMVRDFGVSKDDKEIGRYAGLIASSFFLAQFCCAIFWGSLSDRIGRRPVLLFGLLGNVITCLLFGLSKSFIWALVSRATCGVLNGNVGVAKSMVGELTDRTNQTIAFSLFGFCWGFGCIVGPMTGGYLSNPVDHFPQIFGNCLFLKQFPYFLPCAVSASIGFIGFIVGFFMLPETRNRTTSVDPERKPFLSSNKKLYGAVITRNEIGGCSRVESCNDRNNGKISAGDVCSISSNDVDKDSTNEQKIIVNNGISAVTYTVIASYAIISFHTITFDEVYSIYAVTAIKDGGLGFRSDELALTLAFSGVVGLTCQFLIYPSLRRKVDTLRMYRFAFIAYVPFYCVFPLIQLLRRKLLESEINSEVGMIIIWNILLFTLIVKGLLNVISYTTSMILVNNSATSEVLGTVNGIGQTSASFTRCIGPAFGGFLWSWSLTNNLNFPFNNFFVFIIISVATFIGYIQSINIPSELGYMDEN